MLSANKFDEAEKLATQNKEKMPDSYEALFTLATVYNNQSFKEIVNVNTAAMGLAKGETGTVNLNGKEDVDKYFSSSVGYDKNYGDKTIALYEDIIKKWPEREQPYWCLIHHYQKAKRYDDLIKDIDRLVSRFKDDKDLIDNFLSIANDYYKNGELDKAGEIYAKLLGFYSKSAPLLSDYGTVKLKLHDLNGGLEYLEKAYLIDPSDTIVLNNLGEGYIYADSFDKAKKYLNELTKAKPEDTAIYFKLATIDMGIDDTKAKKSWDVYLEHNKKYPDNESFANFAKQVRAGLDHGLTDNDLLDIATNFNNSKVPVYAVPILLRLKKTHPDDPYILFRLTQSYDVGGHPQIAVKYASQAADTIIKTEKDNSSAIASMNYEAGRLAYGLGDYQLAKKHLLVTQTTNPKTNNLQYLLGYTYKLLGENEEALKWFDACVKSENNSYYHGYCESNLKEMAKQK